MFANQDVDFSLGFPCRRLSAVASSKQRKAFNYGGDDDDDDNYLGDGKTGGDDDVNDEDINDDDDGDHYLGFGLNDEDESSCAYHRFLIGSSFPSIVKETESKDNGGIVGDGGNEMGDDNDEDDEDERKNRLCLMKYHEESHELSLESCYPHPTGEIWSMACHPTKCEWVATCGGGLVNDYSGDAMAGSARFRTVLWRIPAADSADDDASDGEEPRDVLGKTYEDEDYWEKSTTSPGGGALTTAAVRKRAESAASLPSKRLETVAIIPHADYSHKNQDASRKAADDSSSQWNQRVGCLLWNPLLSSDNAFHSSERSPSSSSGSLISVGWNTDPSSPITLWDVAATHDTYASEVWSTHSQESMTGVASLRARSYGRRGTGAASVATPLPRRASWDPHDTQNLLVTCGVDVLAYDLRCPPSGAAIGGGVGVIRSAHRYGVADICHNGQQPNVVMTAGMDGVLKFWDLRMHLSTHSPSRDGVLGENGKRVEGKDSSDSLGVSEDCKKTTSLYPLLPLPPILKAVRGGHSHWATRAVYNPFHDQLVLSGGSDGIANLWRISSCSSAPLLELDGEEDDVDEDGIDDADDEDKVDNGLLESTSNDAEDDVNSPYKKQFSSFNDTSIIDDINDNTSKKEEDASTVSGAKTTFQPKTALTAPDVRVNRFECSHTTADVAWSASDPWVYATLSYDGGLVVHHVPSKEKYKILL